MAEAGFGGVEVAYVYPLGPATAEFLSASFLSDLRFAAERARELGLRFDLTLGSGWSFGGPHVSEEHAARRLRWERREIGSAALDVPVVVPWPGDQLLGAYVGAGSHTGGARLLRAVPIEHGVIKIPTGQGPRQVLLAYASHTGQNVKRAAAGAEGPVLDHYSATATSAHLRAVGDRLLDAVPAELVGSVFCDSLEVYGADWTPGLVETFHRRCGYDAAAGALPVAGRRTGGARVRADYHRTLSRLYEDNFVATIRAGRPSGACRSGSRATERHRPPSAVTGSRTCSRVRGGAGRRSPRRGGPRRRRICTGATWCRRSLDVGALAVVPRDSARPPGRGARAPAQRGQPARGARLAVLTGRRAGRGLGLLRRRGDSTTGIRGGRRCRS